VKYSLKIAVLLGVLICGTGCTTGYWVDRGRDAADIVSVSVGAGIGAKAQVGPLAPGLIWNEDYAGIISGRPFTRKSQNFDGYGADASFLLWGMYGHGSDGRFKEYRAEHILGVPISKSIWDGFMGKSFDLKYPASYFTNLEIVAGVGLTVRAGFNPGELVDFILGFFGVDIYGDDIGLRKKEPEVESADNGPPGPNQ